MLSIRGQVNKFLVKHIFFDRFIFISQHSLLSVRYIWFSNDSPTFSSHPNNMICPILQNKFRRWAALWWISFLRTISSSLETGNNRRGLNLTNMLDGEAIRSGIRWFVSVLGTYESVHCLNRRVFLRQMEMFFL